MIRKYVRRNAPNLSILLIYIGFIYYALSNKYIDSSNIDDISHVDLLTINSIFIGFLFTTLGVLVGFLGNTKIANLDRSGYMDEYYNTIYFGLFFFILSAISGLLAIFIRSIEDNTFIYLMVQITLMAGLLYFIKAIFNLASIIRRVRRSL